jgi:hypothetical protein
MMVPHGLVEVLVEDRPGGDHHIHHTELDHVPEDLAEAGGDEGPGEPDEDGGSLRVPEHVAPDLVTTAQVPGLHRGLLEPLDEVPQSLHLLDVERHDRRGEDAFPRSGPVRLHGRGKRGGS